jgi:hypothetical protein
MGLKPVGIPNPNSLVESSRVLVYPSNTTVANEIPLYIKFTCTEYSSLALSRAGGIINTGGYGNVKAQIAVPMSTKFTSQTAMRYKQEENPNSIPLLQSYTEDLINKGLEKLEGIVAPILKNIPAKYLKGAGKIGGQFNQLIDSDYNELILQSGSKRSFVIQLYLPCLNDEDSARAGEITRAFEALALPTTFSFGVGSLAGFQFFFHPPMWFIGVGALDSIQNDIDWSSQPQASVLTNVAVNRVAIDSSSFTAIDGSIKPIAYSISLNFTEIEAAVRAQKTLIGAGSPTSFEILNRSSVGGDSLGLGFGPRGGI